MHRVTSYLFLASHNNILAHAQSVHMHEEYGKEMNSFVGMTTIEKKQRQARNKMIISVNKSYFSHLPAYNVHNCY